MKTDAAIYEVYNKPARAPILLVCEHASKHIPADLHQLGLSDEQLATHMAWDIGALLLAKHLSDALDARLLYSRVSRLVYDCNRPPHAPDAIVSHGETFAVPGNHNLSASAQEHRVTRFYHPFQEALESLLEQHHPQFLVTVHSFTPVYHGKKRDVDLGVLHDADSRLADCVLHCATDYFARENLRVVVRRNEPYSAQDGVTHTLREHAVSRGVHNVMLELKSSLLTDPRRLEQLAAALCIILRCSFELLETAGEQ